MSRDTHLNLQKMLRSSDRASAVLEAIHQQALGMPDICLMEVCGTHTTTIRKHGIPSLLPASIQLVSGPGCPVCVTPNHTVDWAVGLAREPGVVVTTFGDMLRVPGSQTSLAEVRANGADIRVVYSPLDAVRQAEQIKNKQIIFFGVGFETTAPTVAVAIQRAWEHADNFSVLVAHKLIPPALQALAERENFSVQGFILPGHVSAIIGSDAFYEIVEKHKLACVVAGFEPVDVLLSILMLIRQIRAGKARVEVEYRSAVQPSGNPHAKARMEEVFEPVDSEWRGLGNIPHSGLKLKDKYHAFDAYKRFPVQIDPPTHQKGCRCDQVLVGAIRPPECAWFGKVCNPARPMGPCMVSSEGTCAAYYQYEP